MEKPDRLVKSREDEDDQPRLFPEGFFEICKDLKHPTNGDAPPQKGEDNVSPLVEPPPQRYTWRWILETSKRWHDSFEIILAAAIALLAVAQVFLAAVQLFTTLSNNAATSHQTDQLITASQFSAYASDQNARAASSFARSAQSIDKEIGEAVDKLNKQAEATNDISSAAQDQATAALAASVTSQQALVLNQRPWIGIDDISFSYSFQVPETYGVMQPPVQLKMSISYSVKNVGPSAAIDVIPSFAISALDADVLPRSIFPECTVPDKSHPTEPNRPVFFLMPGEKTAKQQRDKFASPEREGLKKADVIWVQVCISYRDKFGEYYSTKLTYVSSYKPDSPYVTVPGTEFRYRPKESIDDWFMFKGEAK